jgi:hypothetical protein
MYQSIVPFTDEQSRLLVNLEQFYEAWIDAERTLANLPYGMIWKTTSGKDYLCRVLDRKGNATGLGPRSARTEAMLADYRRRKSDAETNRDGAAAKLDEAGRLYRALRLPMIPAEAAAILREADRRRLLGSHLLAIGTNAVPAYCIEAAGRIVDAPDETQDFDMTWIAIEADLRASPVWAMLKSVDSTYTINTERPFQARNARAFEFELLAAPSTLPGMGRRDQPRPTALPEQEWLLKGSHVSHVVMGRDLSPARLVVPDPRWFALQKLWLSDQEKRNPLKRGKDSRQGNAILDAVWETMPQFALDATFESEIPDELRPYYDRWKSRDGRSRPARHW